MDIEVWLVKRWRAGLPTGLPYEPYGYCGEAAPFSMSSVGVRGEAPLSPSAGEFGVSCSDDVSEVSMKGSV